MIAILKRTSTQQQAPGILGGSLDSLINRVARNARILGDRSANDWRLHFGEPGQYRKVNCFPISGGKSLQ